MDTQCLHCKCKILTTPESTIDIRDSAFEPFSGFSPEKEDSRPPPTIRPKSYFSRRDIKYYQVNRNELFCLDNYPHIFQWIESALYKCKPRIHVFDTELEPYRSELLESHRLFLIMYKCVDEYSMIVKEFMGYICDDCFKSCKKKETKVYTCDSCSETFPALPHGVIKHAFGCASTIDSILISMTYGSAMDGNIYKWNTSEDNTSVSKYINMRRLCDKCVCKLIHDDIITDEYVL